MTEQPGDKVKARRWVGIWVKDEKFWKDVAANTVAGLLLAAIVYLFGLAAGYFQRPEWVREVVVFVNWLGVIGALMVAALLGFHLIKGVPDKEQRNHTLLALAAALLGALGAFMTLQTFP